MPELIWRGDRVWNTWEAKTFDDRNQVVVGDDGGGGGNGDGGGGGKVDDGEGSDSGDGSDPGGCDDHTNDIQLTSLEQCYGQGCDKCFAWILSFRPKNNLVR